MSNIVLIALVFVLSLTGCGTKDQTKPTNYPSPSAQVTPAPTVIPTAASPKATQSPTSSVYSSGNSTVTALPQISSNGSPTSSPLPPQISLKQMTPAQAINLWIEALRNGDKNTYFSVYDQRLSGANGGFHDDILPHQISNVSIKINNNKTNNNIEANYILVFKVDGTFDKYFYPGNYYYFVKLVFEDNSWKIDALATSP